MVPRCGWFVKNSTLYCKVVSIEWDLGFSSEAKREYIKRVLDALGDGVGIACDVTSASPDIETRNLSPIFVKSSIVQGISIEDWIHQKGIKMVPHTHGYDVACWHYLISLKESNLNTIARYDCFFDVFSNYEVEPRNSQAYLLGYMKLLMLTHNMDILYSFDSFKEDFNRLQHKAIF